MDWGLKCFIVFLDKDVEVCMYRKINVEWFVSKGGVYKDSYFLDGKWGCWEFFFYVSFLFF